MDIGSGKVVLVFASRGDPHAGIVTFGMNTFDRDISIDSAIASQKAVH